MTGGFRVYLNQATTPVPVSFIQNARHRIALEDIQAQASITVFCG
jgi:hypothetical protein